MRTLAATHTQQLFRLYLSHLTDVVNVSLGGGLEKW